MSDRHTVGSSASLLPAKVQVQCPHCGMQSDVQVAYVGRKLRCRKCGFIFEFALAGPELSPHTAPPVAALVQPPKVEGQTVPVPWSRAAPASQAPAPVGLDLQAQTTATAAGHCTFHREVVAAHTCKQCKTPICSTCEFSFPGGVYLCPNCATAGPQRVGQKRRKYMVWSYVLAFVATLGTVLLFVFSGQAAQPSDEAAGVFASVFSLFPAIVGMALGFASIDRKLTNPFSLWIPTIWNSCIVVLLLILSITGLLVG